MLQLIDKIMLIRCLGDKSLPKMGSHFSNFSHKKDAAPIPAAVLILIIGHNDGPPVLFTQRSEHLHHHPGQISFPGGRVSTGDIDRLSTALRETEEEVGISPDSIEIVGKLPDFDIMSGFRVTPVVGWLEPPVELSIDKFEVSEAFEVPLSHFMNPDNHQRLSKKINGKILYYYAMPFKNRNIWGATAGMLFSLYQIIKKQ